jgi:hypothetical protein
MSARWMSAAEIARLEAGEAAGLGLVALTGKVS